MLRRYEAPDSNQAWRRIRGIGKSQPAQPVPFLVRLLRLLSPLVDLGVGCPNHAEDETGSIGRSGRAVSPPFFASRPHTDRSHMPGTGGGRLLVLGPYIRPVTLRTARS